MTSIETRQRGDEHTLFIASNNQSLDDFLKTPIASGKHVYCSFGQEQLDNHIKSTLNRRGVLSVSFNDGNTYYPTEDNL
ncbi:hypothetical protein [Vibrio sp. WXL103]|uniref:hypothetical protein n=1 Tax=Vibrio sp. WXL103 TaxID=3450710 RepID=UPI003EC6F5B9